MYRLDHPWVNRAGNAVFAIGALQTIIRWLMGLSLNGLGAVLIVAGLALMAAPLIPRYLPRGIAIVADPLESNYFQADSGAKRKVNGEMVPIGHRIAGLPLFNEAASLGSTAHQVKAEITVSDISGGRVDYGHGQWRELEPVAKKVGARAHSTGLSRGVDFEADRQRHVLNILAQEYTANKPGATWHVVRDPLFLCTQDSGFPAGRYRLEIRLRSPDMRRPVSFLFDLEIPQQAAWAGEDNAPKLTRIDSPPSAETETATAAPPGPR